MSAPTPRHQVLLSSAALLGALIAYGRGASAAPNCTGMAPSVQCTGGPFGVPEVLNNADTTQSLAVTVTPAPFQINTNAGNALTITSNGAVSFIDAFTASYLDSSAAAGSAALSITSQGDTTGGTVTPGSVTVETRGTLRGDDFGINALNLGSGAPPSLRMET